MENPSMGRTGRGRRSLQRVPEPPASSEIRFIDTGAPLQFRRLPERAFGCTPSRVAEGQRWKSLVRTDDPLQISSAQILDKHTQRPAIGNGMMNREDQHMVIGGPTEPLGSVKRSSHQIEWLAENLSLQLFDFPFVRLHR